MTLPPLEASDFMDADGARREWGFYPAQDRSAAFVFCRVDGDYYYVDAAAAVELMGLLESPVDLSDAIAALETIYGGSIVIFDEDSHAPLYVPEGTEVFPTDIQKLILLSKVESDGAGTVKWAGESCVCALSEPIPCIDGEQTCQGRVALLISVGDLSLRRIPRLVTALCVSLLFFITAIVWALSAMRVFRRPAITARQRKLYGAVRMRRAVVALGLAGVLSVGTATFFINSLSQLYAATENNAHLLDSFHAVIAKTRDSALQAVDRQAQIHVAYARRAAGVMLAGVLAALYFGAAGRNRLFMLYYVLSGRWTPGVNLFALAKILIVSLVTALALLLLRLVTGVACTLLQQRGETICRLISSFIQYVAILAPVFTAFDCLGFDTRALLASVGVLSLAVSLGAKDLVADVLSGIAIAFSDEYQIGDYIEINGFRGWVQEVGVRPTALVNNDGNIKHFSNRDVKNILNLSRRNCNYTINVTIAGDQSLKKVEEILMRELPRIGQSTPEILRGPEYKGVTGFANGGVTIAISTECKEQNYGKVRGRINREIRLLLEENGITIR